MRTDPRRERCARRSQRLIVFGYASHSTLTTEPAGAYGTSVPLIGLPSTVSVGLRAPVFLT